MPSYKIHDPVMVSVDDKIYFGIVTTKVVRTNANGESVRYDIEYIEADKVQHPISVTEDQLLSCDDIEGFVYLNVKEFFMNHSGFKWAIARHQLLTEGKAVEPDPEIAQTHVDEAPSPALVIPPRPARPAGSTDEDVPF